MINQNYVNDAGNAVIVIWNSIIAKFHFITITIKFIDTYTKVKYLLKYLCYLKSVKYWYGSL